MDGSHSNECQYADCYQNVLLSSFENWSCREEVHRPSFDRLSNVLQNTQNKSQAGAIGWHQRNSLPNQIDREFHQNL